eukprot:NODE_729_length_794_cov_1023.244295_g553_i0.p1 GENE.NODE_729_length_794_cov_1023.244295_g553_i0~~NODE_729_length_794_cov_1023.244295_g553_i0.p1  ORF type:complete len:191 (+),score=14.72 NODE_729_length_794_cov_1023.244295_g553_i0:124-696(+)
MGMGFIHRNLVPLLGVCHNEEYCLLYPYMPLSLKLSLRQFATWTLRLSWATDIANGLSYLHGTREHPHGDVCTTNIFIDGVNNVARLGDIPTRCLMGSVAMLDDIIAYGRVLVEVLTATQEEHKDTEDVWLQSGEDTDSSLKDEILRHTAADWPLDTAGAIAGIAVACRSPDSVNISHVLTTLRNLAHRG